MKRIEYILPVDFIRGSISGSQDLSAAYDGGAAYALPVGSRVSASGYSAIMVAKVAHVHTPRALRFYQVRTRTTVNMSAAVHRNLALLGGSAAMFAALVRDKSAAIYAACVAACPPRSTIREFILPILRRGLAEGEQLINITDEIQVTNPWKYSGTQTLAVPQSIIDKFASELS